MLKQNVQNLRHFPVITPLLFLTNLFPLYATHTYGCQGIGLKNLVRNGFCLCHLFGSRDIKITSVSETSQKTGFHCS